MATTTPNFGWDIPQSTDLVKDGATAIAALGNDIDTSMVDLKGGTTGQILTKASNTDMDFTWSSETDPNAISKTIVDAKGDIITATAADTPARLAVGSNGYILVADSSAATGLAWQQTKTQNAIYNSSFDIYQRSATPSTGITVTGASTYTFDRWQSRTAGAGGSVTTSQQTAGNLSVTPTQAIRYCARFQRVAGNTDTNSLGLYQTLETADSVQFAGKAVTLSFYARKGANYSSSSDALTAKVGSGTGTDQNWSAFTGGATVVENTGLTLTTSWQRFSLTGTVATNATELFLEFRYSPTGTAGANDYFEITGVQLEAGSVATAYARQSGTIQGEFQACCRYYQRFTSPDYGPFFFMTASSATNLEGMFPFMAPMRTAPSFAKGGTAFVYPPLLDKTTFYQAELYATTTGKTAQYTYKNNNGSGDGTSYLEFSAEL